MNCKPGDLAVIRPPTTGPADDVTGRIVTVIERAGPRNVLPDGLFLRWSNYDAGCPAWIVQANTPIPDAMIDRKSGAVFASRYFTMWDHRLRPIRDPGDDAVDETLLWLPAQTTEMA